MNDVTKGHSLEFDSNLEKISIEKKKGLTAEIKTRVSYTIRQGDADSHKDNNPK